MALALLCATVGLLWMHVTQLHRELMDSAWNVRNLRDALMQCNLQIIEATSNQIVLGSGPKFPQRGFGSVIFQPAKNGHVRDVE